MWYKKTQLPFLSNLSVMGLLGPFAQAALADGKSTVTDQGTRSTPEPVMTEVLDALHQLPGAWTIKQDFKDPRSSLIVGNAFIMEITTHNNSLSFSSYAMNADLAAKINEIMARLPLPAAAPNVIYAISSTRDGLKLARVGEVGLPVVPENYSADNFKLYTHVAKDLIASDPCGRLTIMSGSPGTGKTFLVRALVNAAKGATFVMVPPHMIPSLGDPGLISLLIDHKQDHQNQPLIMVLEDADSVLVPRAADNMNSISGLLNLSDGLLGRALDIRIIATTNALIENMDEALTRPGRLCRHITTGALPKDQVKKLCAKLAPECAPLEGAATLAEVYKWARNEGLETKRAPEPRGFNPNRS